MNEQKQYDFRNKAIKCEVWDQMEHLARISDSMGYECSSVFTKSEFYSNNLFWVSLTPNMGRGCYVNINEYAVTPNETIVSYSDFINQSKPAPSVEQLTASCNC